MDIKILIGGLTLILTGVGLTIAGAITKNGAMTGTGATLLAAGLGWLGLPRAQDV